MKNVRNLKVVSFILLLIVLALGITGCNKKDNPEDTTPPENNNPNNAPYTISFVSNGDGTCYVDQIITNLDYEGTYVLEIPEFSPNGDRVTKITCKQFADNLPQIIAPEDFEKLLEKLDNAYENGLITKREYELFSYGKDNDGIYEDGIYYFRLSINMVAPMDREAYLKECPYLAVTDVYLLDSNLIRAERAMLSEVLSEHTDYTPTNMLKDYQHLKDMCKAANITFDYDFGSVSSTASGDYITEIRYPSNVEIENVEFLLSCTGLTKLDLPENITELDWGFSLKEPYLRLGNGVYYADKWAVGVESDSVVNVVLRDDTVGMKEYCFAKCRNLETITIPKGLLYMNKGVFDLCNKLNCIYYMGSAEDWKKITIQKIEDTPNPDDIPRYYYSETTPTEEGNYWHYVDGVPTKW